MRKKIIAGNWKMNLGALQVAQLTEGIKNGLEKTNPKYEILVFPSFVHLHMTVEIFRETRVKVGAQNIYPSKLAAFTGEISCEQLKDFGIQYVLIGHSERRQFLGETNEFLNRKVLHALSEHMFPMLCVGETLQEREAGKTFEVVREQVRVGLKNAPLEEISRLSIAYEPVWAIGTGKVATPEQAEEVHAFIREEIKTLFKAEIAEKMSILYGGSVKPDNIADLLAQPNIDGGLVGGASQKADSFLALLK